MRRRGQRVLKGSDRSEVPMGVAARCDWCADTGVLILFAGVKNNIAVAAAAAGVSRIVCVDDMSGAEWTQPLKDAAISQGYWDHDISNWFVACSDPYV